MTPSETSLLQTVLSTTQDYVEFGTGGSTAVASQCVGRSITSLDSSTEWLAKVADHCRAHGRIQPRTVHADIGPLKEWGWPLDESHKAQWPDYHATIWATPGVTEADTFLVDGRFRVACFMQVLLKAERNPLIMIHDFANRPQYHAIKDFCLELATSEMLSVFRRAARFDVAKAEALLDAFAFTPD